MKRDMDLVRDVLFFYEEAKPVDEEKYSNEQIHEHILLLRDAGFIVTESFYPPEGGALRYRDRLSWEGHEFIARIRENEIWNTIRSEFQNASFETIINVSKQLAEARAKKKVERLLNENS
jgi:hypothetical protein